MTDDTNICGELTDEGEICSLPAGWGRDAPGGPCRHHDDTTTLPRKWTEDRVQKIYDTLDDVPSFKHACESAGITRQTGSNWKRRGRELSEELTEAEIEQDENARRLVSFFDTVNARVGSGKASLLTSAIKYAKKHEDSSALIRVYKQLEGGSAADADDELLEWFDADSEVVRYASDTDGT